MKGCFTILLIGLLSACQAQELISVKEGSPKKDEAFSKALIAILSASGKDFASLTKHFVGKDILDSTWTIDQAIPGASEATIKKSKDYITLSEQFVFGNGKLDILKLLEKIKASMPADFKYSLNYDAASGISDYTFTYDKKALSHPGYPDEFHLNGDSHSATIGIIIFK